MRELAHILYCNYLATGYHRRYATNYYPDTQNYMSPTRPISRKGHAGMYRVPWILSWRLDGPSSPQPSLSPIGPKCFALNAPALLGLPTKPSRNVASLQHSHTTVLQADHFQVTPQFLLAMSICHLQPHHLSPAHPRLLRAQLYRSNLYHRPNVGILCLTKT